MFVLRNLEICEFCNIGNANIKHWLCDCPHMNYQRERFNVRKLCPEFENRYVVLLAAKDDMRQYCKFYIIYSRKCCE